jgi:hypothetical protein
MALIHNNTFPFALDLLSANLQHTNKTDLLLTLSLNTDDLSGLKGMLGIGQTTSGRGETGSHEGRAGEHEADGAAVDLDCWDGGGVSVDEAEVRDWGSVDGLEEKGGGVYCVEGHAVGAVVVLVSLVSRGYM